MAESGFHPPLDIVDGASRIVDPIIAGINTGKHIWGEISEGLPRDGLVKGKLLRATIENKLFVAAVLAD